MLLLQDYYYSTLKEEDGCFNLGVNRYFKVSKLKYIASIKIYYAYRGALLKITSDEHGQFIIIAALMISILIVSVSAIMYGTVTYFRHERWEEYLSLIDTLKIGSSRVVEISLANYTLSMNNNVLRDNLNKWRINLTKAYSGFGIVLSPQLADGLYQVYGLSINYSLGLSSYWHADVSFSAANVTLQMNITSIGLMGYTFISTPLVREEILSADYQQTGVEKNLAVKLALDKEGLTPITNLQKSSFSLYINVGGQWQSLDFSLSRYYDSTLNRFIYELYSDTLSSQPSAVSVTAIETRNIKVVANSTVT